MSRVIIFSRTFPAYHPRKGQSTFFVEKIWKGLVNTQGYSLPIYFTDELPDLLSVCSGEVMNTCVEKHHTIRASNRWKVGDMFSPRVWSGKPYASKQIIIAPDIEVKNVYPITILGLTVWVNGKVINNLTYSELALNDGLDLKDLKEWFNKLPFEGQIICWNENINY